MSTLDIAVASVFAPTKYSHENTAYSDATPAVALATTKIAANPPARSATNRGSRAPRRAAPATRTFALIR
jgi:hypothetical protein|tara:strand:- start:372 stop:581 length:210 start_codon:yes stop_codon:yes gene_type:complete